MSGHHPWSAIRHKRDAQRDEDEPVTPRAIVKSDEAWRAQLSPLAYEVLRHKATERPGTSPFEYSDAVGTYHCAACGNLLFDSSAKFDSGCGWPSFYQPQDSDSLEEHSDRSILFMPRTEVVCSDCGGHLGHVFNDGPPPTHLRYCINGASLEFRPTGVSKA